MRTFLFGSLVLLALAIVANCGSVAKAGDFDQTPAASAQATQQIAMLTEQLKQATDLIAEFKRDRDAAKQSGVKAPLLARNRNRGTVADAGQTTTNQCGNGKQCGK